MISFRAPHDADDYAKVENMPVKKMALPSKLKENYHYEKATLKHSFVLQKQQDDLDQAIENQAKMQADMEKMQAQLLKVYKFIEEFNPEATQAPDAKDESDIKSVTSEAWSDLASVMTVDLTTPDAAKQFPLGATCWDDDTVYPDVPQTCITHKRHRSEEDEEDYTEAPPQPFKNLVRDIARAVRPCIKVKTEAVDFLLGITESFLIAEFEMAHLFAQIGGREDVAVQDMRRTQRAREKRVRENRERMREEWRRTVISKRSYRK